MGPAGIQLILLLIIGFVIFLIIRSSMRKSRKQARIADALEEIAKSKSDGTKT